MSGRFLGRAALITSLIALGLYGVPQTAGAQTPANPVPPSPVIDMNAVWSLEYSYGSPPSSEALANRVQASVQNFEDYAVQEVCADHEISPCSSGSVLTWARNDLRAQEWADLDAIITLQSAGDPVCPAAALSSALPTSSAITSLPVNATTYDIPTGSTVTVWSGANIQAWTTTADAPTGSTSLPVSSQVPNYAYPVSSRVSNAGSGCLDTPLNSADIANVFGWFQLFYQHEQINADQDAIKEYLKWAGLSSSDLLSGTPTPFGAGVGTGTGFCQYQPPGSFSFDGNQSNPVCYTPCPEEAEVIGGCDPDYPTISDFEQWGAYDAQQSEVSGTGYYLSLAGTAASETAATVVAAGSTAVTPIVSALGATGLAQSSLQNALFPYAYSALQPNRALLRGYQAGNNEQYYARVSPEEDAAADAPADATQAEIDTAATEAATDASADTAADVAAVSSTALTAGAVAFVVGIVIFAVVTIAMELYQVLTDAQVPVGLQCKLLTDQGQSTSGLSCPSNISAPDVASAFAGTSGFTAGLDTFTTATITDAPPPCEGTITVSLTAPECTTAPAVPAPSNEDPGFLVTPYGGTPTLERSLYSVGTGGEFDSVSTRGNGWFVEDKYDPTNLADATTPSGSPSSIVQTLSFYYLDWSNNPWEAQLVTPPGCSEPVFVTVPLDPSDQSAISPPTGCKGTSTIEFLEPNGYTATPIEATAEIVPASYATPTATPAYSGPVVVGQSATFSAQGYDASGSALSYSWTFPNQWKNDSITCSIIIGEVETTNCSTSYAGQTVKFLFTTPGDTPASLTVTNSAGYSSTKDFVVDVADKTTTSVTTSQTSSVYGQALTATATVVPSNPYDNLPVFFPAVLGYVQFYLNGATLGTPVPAQSSSNLLSSASTASISLPRLAASSLPYSISVLYLGTSDYLPSGFNPTVAGDQTATAQVTVNPAATTTTVASSADPSVYGQSVHFTASVEPVAPGVGTPTGTVQFYANGANLGQPVPLDSRGMATSPSIVNLPVDNGPFALPNVGAKYSPGDSNFSPSEALSDFLPGFFQTVNPDSTSTEVQSSADPSMEGDSVTFSALVGATPPGAGTPTGTVTFEDGDTVLGTADLASGATTFSTSTLAAGAHLIAADYQGDSDFLTSTSSTLTEYVDTNISSYPKLADGAYNLTNTNLSGGYFGDQSLESSSLSNSNFKDANFTNADLSNADLSNTNFKGADFSGADLTEANLTDANLKGATELTSATLTGVVWDNTECPDGTLSNRDGGTCLGHL